MAWASLPICHPCDSQVNAVSLEAVAQAAARNTKPISSQDRMNTADKKKVMGMSEKLATRQTECTVSV